MSFEKGGIIMFKTEETLTEEQVQSGLSYVIKAGIASQPMGILT